MTDATKNTGDKVVPVEDAPTLQRRHLRIGWWSLLLFMMLGATLELLHLFKLGWYLDVGNETRRVMFRLAHAHGTLLSVAHLCFASAVTAAPTFPPKSRALASRALLAGLVLLPSGFFLGGLFIYDGDPGLGVLLAPAGALGLFLAAFLTARGVGTK